MRVLVEKFASKRELQNDPREIVNRRRGNEVKKLTCGEVSSELDIRVLRFPKNVWKQELGQGKYEISFMVKRGRRKVMSTVLRNY